MFTRRLSPFERLAIATTVITYGLILVGGLVRASGAGLGCPDWPRCFGTWIPPLSVEALPPEFDPIQFNPSLMWTEYLNRLLGVVVGFFILATCGVAWRTHRRQRHVLVPVIAALLLTGYEGWLGGRVVAHELAPWIVTAHLVVALGIVSLLLYATTYALLGGGGEFPRARGHFRVLEWAAAVVIGLTLAQVAIGTQVRGRIDDAVAREVPRSTALSSVGAIDFWHRNSALLVLGGTLLLTLIARRTRHADLPLQKIAGASALLALTQIGVGVVLAYADLPPPAQVAHLALASLLLGALTLLFLLARWSSPVAYPSPAEPSPAVHEGSPPAPYRRIAGP